MQVVLATNNPGKVREFQELLSSYPINLIAQSALGLEEIAETGLTFVENALIKARHAAKMSGLPAIADDSGLVVTALNNAPGIYSARYAGHNATAKDNIKKLLTELKDIPEEQRDAYFYCVLVYLKDALDPIPLICTGIWHGRILLTPQGQQGFGYDPVFYVPTEKMTAAELPSSLKNKISHRGIALQLLLKQLAEKV